MIGRIRERSTFERLSRRGQRIQTSALWCSWYPNPQLNEFQVAFAIGRATGNAVHRNRRRRQIKSILHRMDHIAPLPSGHMIIGARSRLSVLTFAQLNDEVERLIAKSAHG